MKLKRQLEDIRTVDARIYSVGEDTDRRRKRSAKNQGDLKQFSGILLEAKRITGESRE